MSRIFKITAIAAVLSVACGGVALASARRVTGGTTQISVSGPAMAKLAANHLSLSALAPGTTSGSTFSFPISGGRLNTHTLHGKLRHKGGLVISNGTRTVRLRAPEVVSSRLGVWVSALALLRHDQCVRLGLHRCGAGPSLRRVRIARVTGVKVTAGRATGTLRLSELSVRVINRLAGRQIVRLGAPVGTITVAPTLG